MRQIRIEKLIVNCCVGESGDRLTRASRSASKQPLPAVSQRQAVAVLVVLPPSVPSSPGVAGVVPHCRDRSIARSNTV